MQYLKRNGLSQKEFAATVGCSGAHLNEIIKGKKTPGLELAFEIDKATAGEIPLTSWPNIASLLERVNRVAPANAAS